jgi:hypothetical protein
MLIWLEAGQEAERHGCAVSADGKYSLALIHRLISSCSRSMALEETTAVESSHRAGRKRDHVQLRASTRRCFLCLLFRSRLIKRKWAARNWISSSDPASRAIAFEQPPSALFLPPCPFVAATVKIAVMHPAQGHDEFVAHPATERAPLPKLEMMGI